MSTQVLRNSPSSGKMDAGSAPSALKPVPRLVRQESSFDALRLRLNTYIFCSHNFYLFPALFGLLKLSANSGSSNSAKGETGILLFKSLISYVLRDLFLDGLLRLVQSKGFLRMSVYCFGGLLMVELSFCLYVLYDLGRNVTSGMVFLVVAWLYIILLNQRIVLFTLRQKKFELIKKVR